MPSHETEFRVVIPARHASSRLPGKPLLDVEGVPLVVRVWQTATRTGASEVIVATDDAGILEAAEKHGARALMTRPDHPTGTDRLAEVAEKLGWADGDVVVNLQGDEPLVPPALLRTLASSLRSNADAGLATVATRIRDAEELFNPNVVKVVADHGGRALYFSRAPIPWVRGAFAMGETYDGGLPTHVPFFRHIGLYAYRVGTLRRLARQPETALERAESLEQLRAMECGISIHVHEVEGDHPRGVDTPEDLERVRQLFRAASDEGGR